VSAPLSGSVEVGGLRLAFLRWPEVRGAADAGETIFLLHGFLDLSSGMEPLARALRGAGVGAAMIPRSGSSAVTGRDDRGSQHPLGEETRDARPGRP
jgi:alpha-beta hydrolase superfamily lysophospholipase